MTEPPSRFRLLFSADNQEDLAARVRKANFKVPKDRRLRTHSNMERWIISRFLEVPNAGSVLAFPVGIFEGDRPDFLARTPCGAVGLEVTELVTEVEAKYRAVAHKQDVDWYYTPTSRSGELPPSSTEVSKRLQDTRSGFWRGTEPEEVFADLTCKAIEHKSSKVAGYDAACDEHFLVMYDNTAIPFRWDKMRSTGFVERIRDVCKEKEHIFSRVFICSGHDLLQM